MQGGPEAVAGAAEVMADRRRVEAWVDSAEQHLQPRIDHVGNRSPVRRGNRFARRPGSLAQHRLLLAAETIARHILREILPKPKDEGHLPRICRIGRARPCRSLTAGRAGCIMGGRVDSTRPARRKGCVMSHENGETPEHPESPLARPKPEGLREFSPRAILCGLFVAVLMGASYPYVVLKLGFGPNVSVVAAILGYIVLGLLFTRVASLLGVRYRPYNRWENNIVQTAGTAAAQTAFMCVLLAAFDILTNKKGFSLGIHLTWIESFAWLTTAGLLGVLLAVPLRRHYIVEEKLPFADGLAAGETLLLCDSQGPAASRAAVSMLVGVAASALVMLLSEDGHVVNLFPTILVLGTGVLKTTLVGVNWGLLVVGSGVLVGMRINVCMLLGTVLAWVIAPYALQNAGVLGSEFTRDH